MSGIYSPEHIKLILEKTDIVDLISSKIRLQQKGQYYVACCPFHQEKTPSFTVNRDKQFYHCFGCGASGDAIKFLTEHDGMTFPDVVKKLSLELGIDLSPYVDQNKNQAKQNILLALKQATEIYCSNLKNKTVSTPAINYLKQRGITGTSAKIFNIGYALSEWDNLYKNLSSQNFSKQALLDASLININKTNGKIADKFRDRIIFPIKNKHGDIIGFGGRSINTDTLPKYLNSNETIVFNKGHELYGLYEAKYEIRKVKKAIVVEGYFDVIMLHQHGVKNAVASLGTSFTNHHLQMLLSFTDEIIFCFDGDNAGLQAGLKALKICLPILDPKISIKFLILNNGSDPDSFIQQEGLASFNLAITHSLPIFEYIKHHANLQYNLSTIDGKLKYFNFANELIQTISHPILKKLMLSELNKELDLYLETKTESVNTIKLDNSKKFRSHTMKILALIANYPHIAINDQELLEYLSNNTTNDDVEFLTLKSLIKIIHANNLNELNLGFIHNQLPMFMQKIFNIDSIKNYLRLIPEDGYLAEYKGCISILKREHLNLKIDKILEKAKNYQLSKDETIMLQSLLAQQLAID